jgi:hypothetical protein
MTDWNLDRSFHYHGDAVRYRVAGSAAPARGQGGTPNAGGRAGSDRGSHLRFEHLTVETDWANQFRTRRHVHAPRFLSQTVATLKIWSEIGEDFA